MAPSGHAESGRLPGLDSSQLLRLDSDQILRLNSGRLPGLDSGQLLGLDSSQLLRLDSDQIPPLAGRLSAPSDAAETRPCSRRISGIAVVRTRIAWDQRA